MYLLEFNITIKLGFNIPMKLLNAEYWQCANKILQNIEIYIIICIFVKNL